MTDRTSDIIWVLQRPGRPIRKRTCRFKGLKHMYFLARPGPRKPLKVARAPQISSDCPRKSLGFERCPGQNANFQYKIPSQGQLRKTSPRCRARSGAGAGFGGFGLAGAGNRKSVPRADVGSRDPKPSFKNPVRRRQRGTKSWRPSPGFAGRLVGWC